MLFKFSQTIWLMMYSYVQFTGLPASRCHRQTGIAVDISRFWRVDCRLTIPFSTSEVFLYGYCILFYGIFCGQKIFEMLRPWNMYHGRASYMFKAVQIHLKSVLSSFQNCVWTQVFIWCSYERQFLFGAAMIFFCLFPVKRRTRFISATSF